MKRLRDTEGSSPLLDRAKALLDAAPPLPESRERMLRVRRALDEPRGLVVQLRRLPAASMAALIVLFGASAFAAVRVYVAVQEAVSEAERPMPAPKAAKHVPAHATPVASASAEPVVPAALAADAAPAADAAVAEPHATARGAPHPHPHPHAHARARSSSSSSPAVAEALQGSDSELVHRAARALRSEHDPALAARLLEAHRVRSPTGPLAEEALSLQIEALHALRSARAAVLAREYLARYPGGRYAAVAARALADTPP